MPYRIEENNNGKSIVIDGWEKGIAASPYLGIGNIRNMGTSYYPEVSYVNYKRLAATVNFSGDDIWIAGAHSVDVSNNIGWIFASSGSLNNPTHKAVSPVGLIYILDDLGQIFKQSAVNSSTFNILEGGAGRIGEGHGGLAYWNNYLVVFGDELIEFCGDGTGDAGVVSSNWNLIGSGVSDNIINFTTNFAVHNDRIVATFYSYPHFTINDPVQFTTTGTLPTGLSLLTTYYITAVSDNYITVSTTVGGSNTTFSSDGTGTHTITDYANPVPLGNVTDMEFTISGAIVGATSLTIVSYTAPDGGTVLADWQEATGIYDIILTSGETVPAAFTYGSATVNLLSPLLYFPLGAVDVHLLDPTVTDYAPYVSKVDGSLLYANGQSLGRIAITSSPNISFNPGLAITYTVNSGVTSIPEQFTDTIVTMVDLKSQLVIAGQRSIYTWDYLSASTSSPSPVDEQIYKIINILSNVYILAGQKGNIYISNGYSAQVFCKIPDYIAGAIDPVWSWGDIMVHRSRLFFQATVKDTGGNNILAGVFSLNVSPTANDTTTGALVMEAQNSYGLTPASGALSTGVLIDNEPSSNGQDSYYSGWSNGAHTGGIDYNDTTLWQNFEPTIETDIIPIASILEQATFGNIEFKLDRPMATGDQIRIYWRPSLSNSYTLIATTTTPVISAYDVSNVYESQWAQFMVQTKAASSGSSRIPLREVRIHFN